MGLTSLCVSLSNNIKLFFSLYKRMYLSFPLITKSFIFSVLLNIAKVFPKILNNFNSSLFEEFDFILTPTTGTIYKISEVNDNPIELNTNLGYYTNFMNLLDLSAIALPAGFRKNGLPFGVTIIADNFEEEKLLDISNRYLKA